MKWLILVLIVSCGQKNPPAKDVGDSDGDQILNYLEENSELDKFTAKIKPFSEVKATLTFRQGTKLVTVELSNESNLHKISYNLLTKRSDLLKLEDHFSEWSKLRIISSDAVMDFPEKAYSASLRFHTSQETPDYLSLGDVSLGSYLSVKLLNFSGSELKDLLQGKISLSLKRAETVSPHSEISTVRQRTYRVFWNDGKTTNVYYVSHELPFERFLKLKNISLARDIDDKHGLGWNEENKDWWIRNLGEKDKVIIHASEKDISLAMEENFIKENHEVIRSNGKLTKSAEVTKSSGSRLILKIRGTKEARTFQETTRRSRRGGGSQEGYMGCLHWNRNIISSGDMSLTSEDVLNNIVIQTENKAYPSAELKNMAYETLDENGPYLEILFDSPDQNFRIIMPNRPVSTYTRTGEYQWECDAIPRRSSPGVETNEEGHFTMRVDTYIEKLED